MYPTISLGFGLQIPTYFLVLSLAVCLCLIWINRRAIVRNLETRSVLDLSGIVLVAGFVGARLFHVVYEEPAYYWEDPVRIFEFWQGGFVYLGGAIMGLASGVFYYLKVLKLPRQDLSLYLDLYAPVVSFGYLLGRLGCFFAGCCYGKSCELPWAVAGRHPTQLYAFFWELGVLLILLSYESKKQTAGKIFALSMILHGIGRLVMEVFRDDFRGPSWGLSISSWISVCLVIAGVFFFRSVRGRS